MLSNINHQCYHYNNELSKLETMYNKSQRQRSYLSQAMQLIIFHLRKPAFDNEHCKQGAAVLSDGNKPNRCLF